MTSLLGLALCCLLATAALGADLFAQHHFYLNRDQTPTPAQWFSSSATRVNKTIADHLARASIPNLKVGANAALALPIDRQRVAVWRIFNSSTCATPALVTTTAIRADASCVPFPPFKADGDESTTAPTQLFWRIECGQQGGERFALFQDSQCAQAATNAPPFVKSTDLHGACQAGIIPGTSYSASCEDSAELEKQSGSASSGAVPTAPCVPLFALVLLALLA